MCGYGFYRSAGELGGIVEIRVLYMTPIKLTSSVAIVGFTGLLSLNCSDWNVPTSETPALGICSTYKIH